ncbi:molybdopterin-guanine dinucleotide biosynthesis protein A [Natronorubrum tibetense GA33]|uniref:Probable molybdenum cofactor guanylyltransferase n=1 Tax=Natronorubrum tibetense GA33 TaxID=1114856 RepID=L9W8X9_9EURY|nr:molybdopterin-guanine dinucleotide biosynthesis protein A [Natronorubrum tibetense GA33]
MFPTARSEFQLTGNVAVSLYDRDPYRPDVTRNGSLGGVVLAGGYSTRFGEPDKAVTDLAGTPMIRRVVDRLATVADDCVVNCRADQLEPIRDALSGSEAAPRYATDPVPDRGPLSGMQVGLEALEPEYAAVVACDMPFVDPVLLEILHDRAYGRDGAVVRLADGWLQPMQAVYRAETMARVCEQRLSSGDGRVMAALEELDVATVAEADLEGVSDRTFDSIDTQAALRDATRRLEQC